MTKLVLASSSQYRRQQLCTLGYPFTAHAPSIDESPREYESPRELALRLARTKAQKIAHVFPKSIVIGCDQVGTFGDEFLTKPVTADKAIAMVRRYSNQSVMFYSALAVIAPTKVLRSALILTRVQFREFTSAEARNYVELDKPLNCAGAIKSESRAPMLFQSVTSDDPTALMGLPLIKTAEFLREAGINPLL